MAARRFVRLEAIDPSPWRPVIIAGAGCLGHLATAAAKEDEYEMKEELVVVKQLDSKHERRAEDLNLGQSSYRKLLTEAQLHEFTATRKPHCCCSRNLE